MYNIDSTATPSKKSFLDLVEFCMAECDDLESYDTSKSSASPKHYSSYKERLALTREVDLDLLKTHQQKFNEKFSQLQEEILLLNDNYSKISKLNSYSSFIPLNKLVDEKQPIDFELLLAKKKLLVDMSTCMSMNKKKELNWASNLCRLYPLKTIGDGNCLVNIISFSPYV